MSNGLTRGVPVQHELENQDPDVLYNIDEVTGAVSAIVGAKPAGAGAKGKKDETGEATKRGAKKATEPAPSVEKEDVDAPGEGE